ncbi:MAG: helical backbone metal receptor [Actinomycetota bacterium]|nr:helical backbone metal receptor [Actinomycetota bacterium]
MTQPRIVSLVPSATETLAAWDRTPIACTRFCERPDLAHVGGTKDPDIEAIVELAPDLVVLDAEENRLEDHDALVERGVHVHVLRIRSVHDLDPQLGSLAERIGAHWEPIGHVADADERLRVAVPIWKRPWMWLGAPTYGSSLLSAIGVGNVLAADGPYPTIDLEHVAARRPDAVFAPDEPYRFGERHRVELESVAPAVFVDGQDLVWWGARTRGALARLGAVVDELIA